MPIKNYGLTNEQKKIIEDNVGMDYKSIAKLAHTCRTAVYTHLKEKGLTFKKIVCPTSRRLKLPPDTKQKIVRPPARYSNPDYSRVYSNL